MTLCCWSLLSYMSAFIIYINASVEPARDACATYLIASFALHRIRFGLPLPVSDTAKSSWSKSLKNRQVLCQTHQIKTADQPVW